MVDGTERRTLVERELATGEVTGLRMLADRLAAEGIVAGPDALRVDVRTLGAIRVKVGETSVLALPVAEGKTVGQTASATLLTNEVTRDPDWKLQVGVVAVVALFLLVGLIGWLISP